MKARCDAKRGSLTGMSGIVIAAFLLLLFSGAASPSVADEPHPESLLDQLIGEALANNPELRAARENVSAFEERPSQAEALENPRLGLGILNLPVDTFRFDQEPMTQKQIAVVQRFPFPGKLGIKGDIARKELEMAREDEGEKRNALIMQVKVAYWNLLFLQKALRKTEENRDFLREFVRIAETKYSVGMGIQQDVLKAQVELSRMNDRLIALEQQTRSLVARMNTLLARPVAMKIGDLGDLDLVEKSDFAMTDAALEEIALENRPALRTLRLTIEKNELAQRFAEKSYYPDLDVGVSYGQRDDGNGAERPDFLSGTVTVTIPLWHRSKERRKVLEEQANVRKATEQYNAMKNSVLFQIQDILSEIHKYGREVDLFRTGLIPQSKSSLESALSGYQVNKVDFLTLVNNQTTLYNYEIEYYRALANYENKIAELEAAVGKRLF